MKIGLLGGSFDPAHDGHVYISRQALQLIGLDKVWWIISPQNPLKKNSSSFQQRIIDAIEITKNDPDIIISDIEQSLPKGNKSPYYSYNSIAQIQQKFSSHQFIWLMGADNLTNFHKWRNWRQIFDTIPIAIFDRYPYSYTSLASSASIEYSDYRIYDAKQLLSKKAPIWSFIRIDVINISSTSLRKQTNNHANNNDTQ